MSSENQSSLRFSVEESVWFQKGQEVSELVSISLDPDIVIQEHDQYVSIRGALQLTGEYRIEEAPDEEERDYTSVRLVNEVNTREDGISELRHRFPVDITIPKNRVQSLEEVYVGIEAFDYEIPKSGCLQIIADLSISGIHGISQSTSVPLQEAHEETLPSDDERIEIVNDAKGEPEGKDDFVPEVEADLEVEVQEKAQTVVEVEQEQEQEQEEQEEQVEVLMRGNSCESEPQDQYEQKREEDVDLQDQTEVEVLHTVDSELSFEDDPDEEDLFTPFEVEARREAYQESEELVPEEDVVATFAPQIEVKARPEKYSVVGSARGSNESVTAIEEKREPQKAEENQQVKRSENELYLTKIFARDEEEEHSRMKICIVQHGDSLDKIAERYDITVQQLVRVNSLSSDDHVNEGQLLYIPVSV